jgi:hypothetical protein
LEQIEMMEKMERLLYEIESLIKKHQNQQFIKRELIGRSETQEVRDSFESKTMHASYLTHAQAKLD